MKQSSKKYHRIVVKIGSSILCSAKEQCEDNRFFDIAAQIQELVAGEGKEVVVVSSGAIALGMSLVGLKSRPKELPLLQACAALGQNMLMDHYGNAFEKAGARSGNTLACAQVLLTWEDFVDRKRYLNAKNTLATLLKLGSVPVVNENDTISTDEIKFGDNDRLSALVATLVSADLLIILSDVDGLLDRNKQVVKVVPEINAEVCKLACPTHKATTVGGMVTKLAAAKIATDSGIPCVIAHGAIPGIIKAVTTNPDSLGNWTVFAANKDSLGARQRWIAFGAKTKGRIMVDEGAKHALLDNKSLLAVGVLGVEGSFNTGDIISVCDKDCVEFARGKAGCLSSKLDKIKGRHFDKEVIHRDNIAVL